MIGLGGVCNEIMFLAFFSIYLYNNATLYFFQSSALMDFFI